MTHPVSWNKFDTTHLLFALLIVFALQVHQCSGNDYDDHDYTASRAEEILR